VRLFRRAARIGLLGAPCITALALAASPLRSETIPGGRPRSHAQRLFYRQPARVWTEALPIGNGRLGAMAFGGVAEDRLALNEDTLWTGRPHEYHREGAARHLPEIRRLLWEGGRRRPRPSRSASS